MSRKNRTIVSSTTEPSRPSSRCCTSSRLRPFALHSSTIVSISPARIVPSSFAGSPGTTCATSTPDPKLARCKTRPTLPGVTVSPTTRSPAMRCRWTSSSRARISPVCHGVPT
eukprot:542588-Rhodomonas_salina.1